jgi:hypothetical protein
VSETNSEYIDGLNITGLLHNKVLVQDAVNSSVEVYFVRRASYLKSRKKDLKLAMPHLSEYVKTFFQRHKMALKQTASIKILAENWVFIKAKSSLGNARE